LKIEKTIEKGERDLFPAKNFSRSKYSWRLEARNKRVNSKRAMGSLLRY